MRYSKYILLFSQLVISLVITSCRKETITPAGFTWTKVLPTEHQYFGVNAIELNDGNFIISCIGNEDPNQASTYGQIPALLIKIDQFGNTIWQKELPENVHTLWGSLLMSNGNILVYGLNSNPLADNIGLVILDQAGTVLYEFSIYNHFHSQLSIDSFGSLHAIQTQDGLIKLVAPQICCEFFLDPPMEPRLLTFDEQLNLLDDYQYIDGDIILQTRFKQPTLVEDDAQGLYIHSSKEGSWINYFAIQLKLSSQTEEPEYMNVYSHSDNDIFPSRACMNSEQNGLVWATAIPNEGDTIFKKILNLRGQEIFTRGPELRFIKSHQNNSSDIISSFRGFPKNAVITKVKPAIGGGYIAIGTCNINNNHSIPSDYRILVVKLNEMLDVEWVKYPQTDFQALGSDIIKSSSGYLVLGSHLSFGEDIYPLIIKIDQNGNL